MKTRPVPERRPRALSAAAIWAWSWVIESLQWVCQIPRYRPAFERAQAKHGTNVARIIIARQLLRSLYKMLCDQVPFNQLRAA